MNLAKKLARVGFLVGFIGPLLFYVSPFSWFSFESHLVCPWCPYIDVVAPNWVTWLPACYWL